MVEAIREGDIPGVQLRCRQRLPAAAEETWRWLTRAELLTGWLSDEAVVASGPEGSLELAGQDEAGSPRRELGRTMSFEPPRLWVLSFRQPGWPAATRLTFELTPGEPAAGEAAPSQRAPDEEAPGDKPPPGAARDEPPDRSAAGAGPWAGCELSVLQQGFEHLPLSECLTIWEAYRRRWRSALDRLAAALAAPE